MERIYERDENYIKLTKEINILKSKKEQLKTIYKNLIEKDKKIAEEIAAMNNEIELLESENNKLLEEETNKSIKKANIISITATVSMLALSAVSLLVFRSVEMNQSTQLLLLGTCYSIMPASLVLGIILQSKLEKKYVTEKEQNLKSSIEYTEVLCRIEELNKIIEKKELQADKMSSRIDSINERINSMTFNICMKEIELQKKYIHPYLKEQGIAESKKYYYNLYYLPKDEIQLKTKALVKTNN